MWGYCGQSEAKCKNIFSLNIFLNNSFKGRKIACSTVVDCCMLWHGKDQVVAQRRPCVLVVLLGSLECESFCHGIWPNKSISRRSNTGGRNVR